MPLPLMAAGAHLASVIWEAARRHWLTRIRRVLARLKEGLHFTKVYVNLVGAPEG